MAGAESPRPLATIPVDEACALWLLDRNNEAAALLTDALSLDAGSPMALRCRAQVWEALRGHF